MDAKSALSKYGEWGVDYTIFNCEISEPAERKSYTESINLTIREIKEAGNEIDSNILTFLEEKISVNTEDETTKEIRNHARDFVRYIMNESAKIEPRLKMTVVESGSYFSNIRVGLPHEFDFMIDVTPTLLSKQCFDKTIQEDYSDKTEVYSDNVGYATNQISYSENQNLYTITTNDKCLFVKDDDHSVSGSYSLDAKHVTQHLFTIFTMVCQRRWEEGKWKINKYTMEPFKGCAFQISLFFKETALQIDLVPCVKFPRNSTPPAMLQNTELFLSTLIAEKPKEYLNSLLDKLYLVCYTKDTSRFRLSTSQIEKDIFLHYLHPKYLQALKIVKYYFQMFFIEISAVEGGKWNKNIHELPANFQINQNHLDLFGSHSFMPSYMITNLFFHFLKSHLMGNYSHNQIVLLFLYFVRDAFVRFIPESITMIKGKHICVVRSVHFTIYGWIYSDINPVQKIFETSEYQECLNNSLNTFIQLLPNIKHSLELLQFPLIGRTPTTICKKCFVSSFEHMHTLHHYLPYPTPYGKCILHSWRHEIFVLPPGPSQCYSSQCTIPDKDLDNPEQKICVYRRHNPEQKICVYRRH